MRFLLPRRFKFVLAKNVYIFKDCKGKNRKFNEFHLSSVWVNIWMHPLPLLFNGVGKSL